MLHYYYFCHIYLPNINYYMKSLMCTDLQHTHIIHAISLCKGFNQLTLSMR